MTTSTGLELHKTVSDKYSIDFFSLLYSPMKDPLLSKGLPSLFQLKGSGLALPQSHHEKHDPSPLCHHRQTP